jgi:hypothetical protein
MAVNAEEGKMKRINLLLVALVALAGAAHANPFIGEAADPNTACLHAQWDATGYKGFGGGTNWVALICGGDKYKYHQYYYKLQKITQIATSGNFQWRCNELVVCGK